jgi:hypothetical protein
MLSMSDEESDFDPRSECTSTEYGIADTLKSFVKVSKTTPSRITFPEEPSRNTKKSTYTVPIEIGYI